MLHRLYGPILLGRVGAGGATRLETVPAGVVVLYTRHCYILVVESLRIARDACAGRHRSSAQGACIRKKCLCKWATQSHLQSRGHRRGSDPMVTMDATTATMLEVAVMAILNEKTLLNSAMRAGQALLKWPALWVVATRRRLGR